MWFPCSAIHKIHGILVVSKWFPCVFTTFSQIPNLRRNPLLSDSDRRGFSPNICKLGQQTRPQQPQQQQQQQRQQQQRQQQQRRQQQQHYKTKRQGILTWGPALPPSAKSNLAGRAVRHSNTARVAGAESNSSPSSEQGPCSGCQVAGEAPANGIERFRR